MSAINPIRLELARLIGTVASPCRATARWPILMIGVVAAMLVALAIVLGADEAMSQQAESLPLQLERKIPLGDIRGRIDHLAVDLKRQRLFVAELGNDTVGIVDLTAGNVIHRITGLKEPQGVGYEMSTDTLYVANAGDGSVRLFEGPDYIAKRRIDLGSDADNIRIDSNGEHVIVGYGDGALAIIDAATHDKVASVPLKAHPESFQIDESADRIFVNVPKARAIEVVDKTSRKKIASWSTAGGSANFAMALDHVRHDLLVAFRRPAELGVFSMADGSAMAPIATCGDIDDLFVDPKRDRVYVSCGEGFLDVLAAEGASYRRIAHIASASGARTSLFVPELDRLLLAVPAKAETPAAIWIFRPVP
jgi:DNA-binding beta-propeller fold protein YncE